MLYFDLVEVGNKVYHYPMGVWGEVIKVEEEEFEVDFDTVSICFDKEGRDTNIGGSQVVFYEEPNVTFKNPLEFAPFKLDRELRRLPLATVSDMTWSIITYQVYEEDNVVKTRYSTQTMNLEDNYNQESVNWFFKLIRQETTCLAGLIPFKPFDNSIYKFVDNLNKKEISFVEFSEVYLKYYLTLVSQGHYPFKLYSK